MRRRTLALLPLLTGCYTYALIEPSTARPGMELRAHISSAAAERLTPLLGAVDDRRVTGTLLDSDPTNFNLEVPKVIPTIGSSVQTLSQRVSIARSDVIGLEMRTLDKARTGIMAGGLAVIVGAAAIKAIQGQSSSGGTVPGGGTDLRIPLFRFVR